MITISALNFTKKSNGDFSIPFVLSTPVLSDVFSQEITVETEPSIINPLARMKRGVITVLGSFAAMPALVEAFNNSSYNAVFIYQTIANTSNYEISIAPTSGSSINFSSP